MIKYTAYKKKQNHSIYVHSIYMNIRLILISNLLIMSLISNLINL